MNSIAKSLNLAVLLCLLAVVGFAQEAFYPIGDFSGGLNVADNAFLVQANQAQECTNILLDEKIGSLYPRGGYDKPLSVAAFVTGLYVSGVGGGQRLFLSLRAGHSGYINVTGRYDHTEVAMLPINPEYKLDTAHTSWAESYNKIFCMTGRARTKVISTTSDPDSFAIDLFPVESPGQPIVRPISSGNLDGEYMWAFHYMDLCGPSVNTSCGPPSIRLEFHNEQAVISNFPVIPADSCYAAPVNATIFIVRTRAGRFEPSDSLFIVDTITYTNSAQYAVVTITDNVSDASFGAAQFWTTIALGLSPNPTQAVYRGGSVWPRPGTMQWLKGDSAEALDLDTILPWPSSTHHEGNFYTYTYLNPRLGGVQSDTARSLLVNYRNKAEEATTLSIAPPPYNSGFLRVVYRARYEKFIEAIVDTIGSRRNPDDPRKFIVYRPALLDTIDIQTAYVVGPYVPLDTIKNSSQITFLDTFAHPDMLLEREPYQNRAGNAHYAGAISHEGRMWFWTDSRIYAAVTDSPGVFVPGDNISFDDIKTDPIVACRSFDGSIVVYRSNSIWVISTEDGFVTLVRRRAGGIGLVSDAAITEYGGVTYFLAYDGVYRQMGGDSREFHLKRNKISRTIDPILVRDPGLMQKACLIANDDRVYVSFVGSDTTFVYFIETGGWSAWTFDFDRAVLYDTDPDITSAAGSELHFAYSTGFDVFRYRDDILSDFSGVSQWLTWRKKKIDLGLLPAQVAFTNIQLYVDTTYAYKWRATLFCEAGLIFQSPNHGSDPGLNSWIQYPVNPTNNATCALFDLHLQQYMNVARGDGGLHGVKLRYEQVGGKESD